jgi:uncharacterized protein YhbP (UPF0306 family)
LSLSTVSVDALPWGNTCYFAMSDAPSIVILTPPTSAHGQNLQINSRCVATIAFQPVDVGEPIFGAQLECVARLLERTEGVAAFDAYCERHPTFRAFAPSSDFVYDNFESRFYSLAIVAGKLIDEATFGPEQYIKFRVVAA